MEQRLPNGAGEVVGPANDGSRLEHARISAGDEPPLVTDSDDDGTVRLWPVTPGDPDAAITSICHALHRGLTAHEWAQYLPGRPARRGCAS